MCHTIAVVILLVALVGDSFSLPQREVTVYDPIQTLLTSYQQGCLTNTGTANAYQNLKETVATSIGCVEREKALLRGNSTEESNIQVVANNTTKCVIISRIGRCFSPTINAVAKCLPRDCKTNQLVLDRIVDGVSKLMYKICGDIITQVRFEEGSTCLGKLKLFGEECKVPLTNMNIAMSDFTAAECRALDESKNCIKLRLDSCGGAIFMDLFDIIYKSVGDVNECEKYNDPDIIENEI